MIKKLLLSFLAIFGFAFLFNDSVFADSPTVVIDGSNYTNEAVICDSSNPCNAYDFIHISSTLTGLSSSSYLRLSVNNTNIVYNYYILTDIYIPTDNISSFKYGILDNYYSWGDNSLVFTLEDRQTPTGTLNITSNGTFDVTNYSTAVVDVPQTVEGDGSFIVNLFKGGFWNVATAIVSLIVPVLALFLVFRLIHGLIYGKGV